LPVKNDKFVVASSFCQQGRDPKQLSLWIRNDCDGLFQQMVEQTEIEARKPPESNCPPKSSKNALLKLLGPGLITGASDDDPSGIATYSQAGAQFGYQTLWTMLLSYPLMTAVQLISALIGRVTGRGIAGNMRRNYHPAIVYFCVGLMVIANTINIGADIAAMGAAGQLVFGGKSWMYAMALTVGCLLLQIFLQYTRYVKILKWLTLVLFAYVGTAFVVKVPWLEALKGAVIPSISFRPAFLTMLAAIFGTTISPYLFFWQASEEVEDVKCVKEDKPLTRAPEQAPRQMHRINVDTYFGMAVSNLIAAFIILTTAATLHAGGKTNIETAAQAAEALRPIAGKFAFLLFSLGIIGTGLLSLPVLAGSAAYAVGELFRWRTSLESKPHRARKFYLLLTVIMLAGLALNVSNIDPIKALFWSAVVNGIAAPPIMIVMMLIATNAEIMKEFVLSRRLKTMGWISTVVMTIVAVGSIVGWLSGK
jgi:NRAMP (natural resistance-associated macrophage protein)-like metal ion transporter